MRLKSVTQTAILLKLNIPTNIIHAYMLRNNDRNILKINFSVIKSWCCHKSEHLMCVVSNLIIGASVNLPWHCSVYWNVYTAQCTHVSRTRSALKLGDATGARSIQDSRLLCLWIKCCQLRSGAPCNCVHSTRSCVMGNRWKRQNCALNGRKQPA